MKSFVINRHRRSFLIQMLAGGAAWAGGLSGFIRTAFGMGVFSYPSGIQKLQGEVKVNGIRAKVGKLVKTGDVVTTGPDSLAIIVINRSVYLLRDNTHVEFSSETSEQFKLQIVDVLRIINGKMLSVFDRRKRSIITQTAVIGIRGTGIYIESEPERSYICTCYGVADIESKATSQILETVRTTHHEAPRYVYAPGAKQLIAKAPVKNHTDSELIMLEKYVGRRPPFMNDDYENRGYY
jgi:hypothetical protein